MLDVVSSCDDWTRPSRPILWLCYARYNNGYKYLLTIIDIFSKYASAVLIKTKGGEDVTDAMKYSFEKGSRTTKIACGPGQGIL